MQYFVRKGNSFGVCFIESFHYVQYFDEIKNHSDVIIDNDYYTIISTIGLSVKKEYQYQNEIRINLRLMSQERIEIPYIKEVEIPFNPEEIDTVIVEIGKNVGSREEEFLQLKDKYPWLKVIQESNN